MDMAQFVIPKSDQLNADDLLVGPRTIRITKVSGTGNADQPVAVYFDGDDGKPYKPCKSMRRVMIFAWGVDAAQYVGRSMTLVRDPDVMFGGMKVGGIRISHMSHITGPMNLALTVTKAKRSTYKVLSLAVPPDVANDAPPRTQADNPVTSADPAPFIDDWELGEIAKPGSWSAELGRPTTGETRYFVTLTKWVKAMDYLLGADNPAEVWDANQTTFTELFTKASKASSKELLKNLQDHAAILIRDTRMVEQPGG